jgi:membrane dipeptidase
MDDDMIKALAKNGGVIQINFGSAFVVSAANQWGLQRDGAFKASGQTDKDAFTAEYKKKNPYPFASLEKVLDHIDYVKNLVGIDYVGIGSDFDGVGDSLPEQLKDVSMYPNLIRGLLERGYTEKDIEKVLSGNTLRVWRAVEDYAAKH